MEKNGKVLSSAIEVIVKVLHQGMKIIGEGGGGVLTTLGDHPPSPQVPSIAKLLTVVWAPGWEPIPSRRGHTTLKFHFCLLRPLLHVKDTGSHLEKHATNQGIN